MDDLFRQIGRYAVLSRIGSGGFATVYRARDTNLDREVALKVMRPLLLSDVAFVERFRQEARVVANLDHPSIVPVYDYGDIEDRLCLVMKLLPGGSLADLLAAGPLPWPRVLQLTSQIAAALDYAHERGLVHRDVKPENVLLDGEGNAVLGDFGLVRALESGRLTTSLSGGVLGTPAYLAPEVWNGQSGTRQTDVYSMACLVFEMVSGMQLFDAPTPPATMMLHFRAPQFPESWPQGVPPGVERVLRKALARHAEDRQPTAGAFAVELAALADDPLAEPYAALEAAIAAGQWHDAVALGERIVGESPGYREARQLLDRALAARMESDRATWAAQWKAQAERALAVSDWEGALSAARRWQQFAPDDGDAAAAVEQASAEVAQTAEPESPIAEKVTFTPPDDRPGATAAPAGAATSSSAAPARQRQEIKEEAEIKARDKKPGRWQRAFHKSRILPAIFTRTPGEATLPAGDAEEVSGPPPLPIALARPVVTYLILVINILIFVLVVIEMGTFEVFSDPYYLIQYGAFESNRVVDDGQVWRFITTLFVHADLALLILTTFALVSVGRVVEARYGSARFAFIYFGSGLLANAVAALLDPDPLFFPGAHPAVFGILAAQLALYTYQRRHRLEGEFGLNDPPRRYTVITILFIALLGLAILRFTAASLLLGLLAGFALGYLLAPHPAPDESAPGGYRDRATLRRRWWVPLATLVLLVASLLVFISDH
ncbi:MAG: rhomboid family intramembrane serine protease [Anaerolineae bacterium]|nr:rhomboid family intramembrane serine protease [Anaerolineae bacterium]